MADSKRKKFIVPGNRLRQMQQDLRERKGAYDKNNTDSTGPNRTTQRANFIRMETEGRVGKATYNKKPKKYMRDDLPMSREGSPTVTDTETGETTYGRPKDFNKGGMMECRGGGIAITGKKFQGVF